MHDGQNVFNPATSTHKIPWGVDEVLTSLIAAHKVRETIVVAAWCNPLKRANEYMPAKALDTPRGKKLKAQGEKSFGPLLSDEYLKFLVAELKPFVDTSYRTLPGQPDTFIMGSSMGGLISLYALCEYPRVFGGAGCVSTHWVAGDGICVDYMRTALPRAGTNSTRMRSCAGQGTSPAWTGSLKNFRGRNITKRPGTRGCIFPWNFS
jgi:predicted alpha/beta superfamily hydrolase